MQPGGLDGSQLIPGLAPSMDPLEALLGPFPCARVRGLPFEATLEDVLVFFQGLVVIDVVLVPHPDSGEAFVVFANPMDFQMGLQRLVEMLIVVLCVLIANSLSPIHYHLQRPPEYGA